MIDIQKFARVRDAIAAQRGPLTFFGVFMPEVSAEWDVLVASPNLEDTVEDLRYVFDAIRAALTDEERRQISRVLILPPETEWLRSFLSREVETSEPALLPAFHAGWLPIRYGYVFTAHPAHSLATAR